MNAETVSANPLLEDALTALPEIAQRLTVQPAVTPYPDWREWPAYDACVPVTAQACSALVAEWVSQAAARMAVRLPWRLPAVTVPPVAEVVPGDVAERIGAAMPGYAAEVGAEPFRDEMDDLEATPAPDATAAEYQAEMDDEFNAPEDPVQAARMDRFNAAHDAEAGPDGTTVMPAVSAETEAIPAVTEREAMTAEMDRIDARRQQPARSGRRASAPVLPATATSGRRRRLSPGIGRRRSGEPS